MIGRTPVERDTAAIAGGVVPVDRRVAGPAPAYVYHARVVVGHVDDPGACRLDVDILGLPDHPHVFIGAQVAVGIGFRTQVLDGIEHTLFLHQESVAEALCPVEVLVQALEQFRERDQRLDAGIPVHALDSRNGLLAAQ